VGSKGASDEGKKLDAQLTGRVLGSPVQLLAGARGRVEVQNQPTTRATEPDDVCFASFGQLNARDTHSTILPLIAGSDHGDSRSGIIDVCELSSRA
jgi:hypothetical protein